MSNSKYLIECLDEVIKPLILILPKIIGYIKTFIEKNNELMSFCMHEEKLLERIRVFGLRLKNLPVVDNGLKKTETKTYVDKVYSNFCGLNIPEDAVECKSFTIIYSDYLIIYIYIILLYLLTKANTIDNCAYKIVNTNDIILVAAFLSLVKVSF